MRKENWTKVASKRLKRMKRKGLVNLWPTSNKIQKGFPNRRWVFRDIVQHTSIRSFQTTQIRACRHRIHSFLDFPLEGRAAQEEKWLNPLTGITRLMLAIWRSSPHRFQTKAQKQMIASFDRQKAKGAGIGAKDRWGWNFWITSTIGALFQANFHKKAWTFEGARGNQMVLRERMERGRGN